MSRKYEATCLVGLSLLWQDFFRFPLFLDFFVLPIAPKVTLMFPHLYSTDRVKALIRAVVHTMSFGWSVSVIALLIPLAYRTIQNAREACGEYDVLTHAVSSLHILLQRLDHEANKPGSTLQRPGETYKEELETFSKGCEIVSTQLDTILVKYNALSG